jgi:hypothetical protein
MYLKSIALNRKAFSSSIGYPTERYKCLGLPQTILNHLESKLAQRRVTWWKRRISISVFWTWRSLFWCVTGDSNVEEAAQGHDLECNKGPATPGKLSIKWGKVRLSTLRDLKQRKRGDTRQGTVVVCGCSKEWHKWLGWAQFILRSSCWQRLSRKFLSFHAELKIISVFLELTRTLSTPHSRSEETSLHYHSQSV